MDTKEELKYDLVLYGATGFTGQLAVKYVAERYKDSLNWAIAGRNMAKLAIVAKSVGNGHPDIIVADSTKYESLQAMCAKTKVIATTAGPFARYGTPVVKACVEAGIDYCDITGESNWVREMIAQYDDAARKSGSRVVSFCGHDCVPWDLLTMKLAERLKEKSEHPSETMARVDMYDKIRSKPSGGTMETAMGIMFGKEKHMKKSAEQKALGYDPMLKSREGKAASTFVVKNKSVSSLKTSSKSGEEHRVMFFMSGVNATAVKRSNALLKYGPKVEYCEGVVKKNMYSAIIYLLGLLIFGLCLYIPPIRWLMKKFVLPKPGEGPSEQEMDKGFLRVTGVAKGTQGTVAKATIMFKTDPGYRDTARMLVESALSLSLDSQKLVDSQGGVYTPAACQGNVLLDRLIMTGSVFSFHD